MTGCKQMTHEPNEPEAEIILPGRPSKYRQEYCERAVDYMRGGASITAFAAEIGVSRSTLHNRADTYPEFLDALKRGKAACTAWWEDQARRVAVTGGGNGALIIFALKNMGAEDWRDKPRDEDPGPANADEGMALDVASLSTETLRELLSAMRDKD